MAQSVAASIMRVRRAESYRFRTSTYTKYFYQYRSTLMFRFAILFFILVTASEQEKNILPPFTNPHIANNPLNQPE